MCGILAALNKKRPIDSAACERALSILSWRGPDLSCSFIWENRAFLGQTILSITGEPLESKGDHLSSSSGRYHLLFNGEIYNFRSLENMFLKHSGHFNSRYGNDSEVLVNLHEILSPERVQPLLDGMYSYVIFDSQKRTLHIACDVQGEKALYMYEDSEWIIFSSEIRAIKELVLPLNLNMQSLKDYFRTRHLMQIDNTIYENIRLIFPGTLLTVNLQSSEWHQDHVLKLSDWIDPDRFHSNENRTIESLVDELDEILRKCIREMAPSARQFAVVVSGGVDSSLLAYYFLKEHSPGTLVAVNHIGKDRISSDLSGFERVLDHKIEVIDVDMPAYASEIDRCQAVCGAPLLSHSFVPQAIQSAFIRSTGCRVLIGGEGGDEYFGGYESYLKGGFTRSRFSPSPYTNCFTPKFIFSNDDPSRTEQCLERIWSESLDAYAFVENEKERILLAMMYCDAAYQLPSVGLRGADLMSMMWSIETRSLYIRQAVARFALNLPSRMKAETNGTLPKLLSAKPILKQLFLRYFPIELLHEKQGFAGFPNESAVYLGDIRGYISPTILEIKEDSIKIGIQDRDSFWKLVNIEYFLRRHMS